MHIRAEDAPHKCAIKCRLCFSETGELKFVDYQQVFRYVSWLILKLSYVQLAGSGGATLWRLAWQHIKVPTYWEELCSECVVRRGSTRKFTEDKESKISKTVTLFGSLVVDGMVGTVYETCKCLYFTTEQSARNHWDQRIDVCPYHQTHHRELRARLEFLEPQSEGKEKKRKTRSKRAEPLTTVNGKSLEDLNAAILTRYDILRVNSLVNLELVAQDAGLGRVGVGDGGQKNVGRLLKRSGVTDSYPVYRDKLITARREASSAVPQGMDSTRQFNGTP